MLIPIGLGKYRRSHRALPAGKRSWDLRQDTNAPTARQALGVLEPLTLVSDGCCPLIKPLPRS